MGKTGTPGIEGVKGEKVGAGFFFYIFVNNFHVPLKPSRHKDSTTKF